jgi:hypothetical protein
MIISSIDTLDQLNAISYSQFLESDLITFNLISAYVINNNLYSNLRAALQIESYSDYSLRLIDDNPESTYSAETLATFETYAPLADGVNYYFYPYSIKEFTSQFFSGLVPTLAESIISLMKSTGRITQIGGGSGKAIIVKTQLMTDVHFQSIPKTVSPQESILGITDALSSLTSYVKNNEYLYDVIAQKDQLIIALREEVNQLNNKVVSVYQTTWR